MNRALADAWEAFKEVGQTNPQPAAGSLAYAEYRGRLSFRFFAMLRPYFNGTVDDRIELWQQLAAAWSGLNPDARELIHWSNLWDPSVLAQLDPSDSRGKKPGPA